MTGVFTYPKLFRRNMITNWLGGSVQKRPKPERNTWSDDVWNKCENKRIQAIERRNSRGGARPEPEVSTLASQEPKPEGITLTSSEKNQCKPKPEDSTLTDDEWLRSETNRIKAIARRDSGVGASSSNDIKLAAAKEAGDVNESTLDGANEVDTVKENFDNGLTVQKKRASKLSASRNRREKRDSMSGKSGLDFLNPVRALNDDGLQMTLRNQGKTSHQYVCKVNRSTGCDRQIRVNRAGMIEAAGSHNEFCYHKAGMEAPEHLQLKQKELGHLYHDEMRLRTSVLAKETTDNATEIWRVINDEFIEKGGSNYQGLRKSQVTNLVYNLRAQEAGVDAVSKVEMKMSGRSSAAFLRKSAVFTDQKKAQRMMCFAIPELLQYLLYTGVSLRFLFVKSETLFLDGSKTNESGVA